MPKLLIADDEPRVTELLAEELKDHGYDVVTVADGAAAVVRAVEEEFDCIILDVKMPEMDGVGALRSIRQARPHVPIIIITAHIGEGYMFETKRLGATDFITKPFKLSVVKEAITRVMQKASEARKGEAA
jgi:DNA-binding response OmpR family regulator